MDLLVLIFTGFALAKGGLLVWKGRGDHSLPGCGTGSACDEVTKGRWSRLGSLRVANLGLIVYLLMFASDVGTMLSGTGPWRPLFTATLVTTSTLAVGAAIWFTFLQAFVIRRWCLWCVATHGVAIVAGGSALLLLASHNTTIPDVLGMGLLAAFVAGQVLLKPKLYGVVDAGPRIGAISNPRACQLSDTTSTSERDVQPQFRELISSDHVLPPAHAPINGPRIESFFRGRVTLDVNDWPVLGSRDAKHLLVDFFDYTCVQCRELHKHVLRLRALYPHEIAVLMVPIPLERKCNPHVCKDDIRHLNACEFARYAIAVWLADETQFAEYDRWLFEPTTVLGLGAARVKAEELVGKIRFDEMLSDTSVARRMNEGIAQYMGAGGGPIPQLLLRDSMLLGQIPAFEIVRSFVESNLRIGKNSASSATQLAR